ncbi:MAG: sulfotransferase domain-containing protein [Rubricoccaceae bacterium]|nr:sulfotransferase domain-containing protein [Rubricoccaceae bacterium]
MPPAAPSLSLPVRALYRLRREASRAGLPPELLAPELLLRQATAARRADPHFLIIGTQKGGTTTLYDDLARHPHVLPAYEKEVHYFDHHHHRGRAWYRRHFPLRSALDRAAALTGEASPSYLYHPLAPGRIAEALPGVKMVALLREPVGRAVSQYWHMVRAGKEALPMAEAFAAETERLAGEHARILRGEPSDRRVYFTQSYRHRGLYADQLARYLDRSTSDEALETLPTLSFRR